MAALAEQDWLLVQDALQEKMQDTLDLEPLFTSISILTRLFGPKKDQTMRKKYYLLERRAGASGDEQVENT